MPADCVMSMWFSVAGQHETELTHVSKDKVSTSTSARDSKTSDNEAVVDSQGDCSFTVI